MTRAIDAVDAVTRETMAALKAINRRMVGRTTAAQRMAAEDEKIARKALWLREFRDICAKQAKGELP